MKKSLLSYARIICEMITSVFSKTEDVNVVANLGNSFFVKMDRIIKANFWEERPSAVDSQASVENARERGEPNVKRG